jgi:uncharacterized protein DUF2586
LAGGGNVNITISDGGNASIIVPGASVQLVIGCCAGGVVGQTIATRNPATLLSSLGYGPLTEAASLAAGAGGLVLAIKAASNTAGTSTAVTFTGTGTSVITLTGVPVDTYYGKFTVVAGGTVGVAGITFTLSMDAGRNTGPVIALGIATTYAIPNTGQTLNFAAGTLVAVDRAQWSTTEPLWNTAGISAALSAFQSSQYALQGVGSTHIVGKAVGADVSTINGYLDVVPPALATGYIFTRSFFSARDAIAPVAWGGAGETEATWTASILTDYSAVSARRACVGAAHWNMPTALPQPTSIGAPSYRRPMTWAAAAKQVTIAPQRHLGRVKDGANPNIVVNASADPLDGFIYHDERINPNLDSVIATGSPGSLRFMSTMTRTGLPGVYITNPLTMAPPGSDFFLMPFGNVMDVFASIVHTVGQQSIDDDVRLNNNGTIYENDARAIESAVASAANTALFSPRMVSQPIGAGPSATGSSIVIDRTTNVRATSAINVTGTLVGKGYILTENWTLSFLNPGAAV